MAMAAPAFTKFNPRAFLENEAERCTAAKPAKTAKAPDAETEPNTPLASLATLAGAQAEAHNFESSSDTWTDAEEERAAVIEYDGGARRAWAVALARLDPAKPPSDVPFDRWQRFIDDCGRFLDQGWANRAEALGWGPLDLFGCDRERPLARHDHMGLLWIIQGRRLVALTGDTATIDTLTGSLQTYRRRPVEVGRIMLPWVPATRDGV